MSLVPNPSNTLELQISFMVPISILARQACLHIRYHQLQFMGQTALKVKSNSKQNNTIP